MTEREIIVEGPDYYYSFFVVIATPQEVKALAKVKAQATFIDDRVYFCEFTDDVLAHECLHITFEYCRKTVDDLSFDDLLDRKDGAIAGEEFIAFTFSDIYTRVKEAIKELTL